MRKIIKIEKLTIPVTAKISNADIVIKGDQVIKDRYGPSPRPATKDELRRAVPA